MTMTKRERAFWRSYVASCTCCGGLGDSTYKDGYGDECERCHGTRRDPEPSIIVHRVLRKERAR